MKIIAIGDLHGKDCWKTIDFNKYDTAVFVGDYCDSFYFTNDQIYNDLLDIIELKKSMPDKIILLRGNHDQHYAYYPDYRCSGFRADAAPDLQILFNENRNLFQVAYQYKNYLFTHAGVSNAWYNKYKKVFEDLMEGFGDQDFADCLNAIGQSNLEWILNEVGEIRGGSKGNHGGPFWADYSETLYDHLKGFRQICGHTARKHIATCGSEVSKDSITYIDVLDNVTEFYELTID